MSAPQIDEDAEEEAEFDSARRKLVLFANLIDDIAANEDHERMRRMLARITALMRID